MDEAKTGRDDGFALHGGAAPAPDAEGSSASSSLAADATTAAKGPDMRAQTLAEIRHDKNAIRRIFETGEYPYKRKISRPGYEKNKAKLQVELLKLQEWVKKNGPENRHPF